MKKKTLRSLQASHISMPIALLLFYIGMVFLGRKQEKVTDSNMILSVLIVFAIVFCVCYIGQRILHHYMVRKARQGKDLEEKLVKYRKAATTRNLILQAATFVGCVSAMVTQLYLLLLPGIFVFFLYLITYPRKKFVTWELQLSEKEAKGLDEYSQLIS